MSEELIEFSEFTPEPERKHHPYVETRILRHRKRRARELALLKKMSKEKNE